jgi:hypothetical protein
VVERKRKECLYGESGCEWPVDFDDSSPLYLYILSRDHNLLRVMRIPIMHAYHT